MKGISEIIAVILMLMIVVGLAGTAYTYISSSITGRSTKQIDIIDASCNTAIPGTIYVTVKNFDPKLNVTPATDLIVRLDNSPVIPTWSASILPLTSSVQTITPCASCVSGSTHAVKVIGPSNSIEKSTAC